MQRLYTLFSLFLMLCILSSASCEKDPEVEPEKPEELIIGKWQRTKIEVMRNGVWEVVNTPLCQSDDTEEFTKDGKWVFSENGTSCSTRPPAIVAYTFRFSGENEFTTTSYVNAELIHTIDSIDKTKIVYQYHNYDVSKSSFRHTLTRL